MIQAANKDFASWACSLAGCDGGNPNADIWLCGIEWGFDTRKASAADYYQKELPAEIAAGRVIPSESYKWDDSLTYTYGRNVAKIFTSIKGGRVEEYQTVTKLKGQELFKLNLYPIAFTSTDDRLWKEYGLDDLTGFKEKHLYQTWCFLNRFPAIAKMVSQYRPGCIICTGISYLTDFFVCFAGGNGMPNLVDVVEVVDPVGKSRKFYWALLETGTVLVVIPFFSGSFGLNSNYFLQEIGSRIGKLINQCGAALPVDCSLGSSGPCIVDEPGF